MDLIERLLKIEVSALCDADKALPVLDPDIRPMVPGIRMAGPAFTVTAEDDHLPVFSALAEASPGDVLVIATNGGTKAVLGELFARATTPASGSTVSRAPRNRPVRVGGLAVSPGDIVFGDDDGVVIASAEQIEAALGTGEHIGRAERAMLDGMAGGTPLHDMTNHAAHTARLDAGEESALAFEVEVDA